jgi:hypothetical protein
MDIASRALALLFLLPALAYAGKEQTIYHIAVQGSTQLSCKITHKATKAEPYLLLTCDYRCDRPMSDGMVDAKDPQKESILCRSAADGPSPAAQGQPLDSATPETTETIETKEN